MCVWLANHHFGHKPNKYSWNERCWEHRIFIFVATKSRVFFPHFLPLWPLHWIRSAKYSAFNYDRIEKRMIKNIFIWLPTIVKYGFLISFINFAASRTDLLINYASSLRLPGSIPSGFSISFFSHSWFVFRPFFLFIFFRLTLQS